jgi:hypothetical protein
LALGGSFRAIFIDGVVAQLRRPPICFALSFVFACASGQPAVDPAAEACENAVTSDFSACQTSLQQCLRGTTTASLAMCGTTWGDCCAQANESGAACETMAHAPGAQLNECSAACYRGAGACRAARYAQIGASADLTSCNTVEGDCFETCYRLWGTL